MIFFRIFVGVITFTAAAWAVNKTLKAATGKDIDENLDSASDKILEFVGYKDAEPSTTGVGPILLDPGTEVFVRLSSDIPADKQLVSDTEEKSERRKY